MKREKTHVAIVLDKSGSMGYLRDQVIKHFNEQVEVAENNSKEQDITFSLVAFNEDVWEHTNESGVFLQPINEAAKIDRTTYAPGGGTALFDALGYTIDRMKKEADEDAAFLLMLITDGEERDSSHIKPTDLKKTILACQKTGKWTISVMGCSEFGLQKLHKELGIPLANMAVWSCATPEIAEISLQTSNRNSRDYYGARTRGVMASANYMSAVSGQVANFVPVESEMPTPFAPTIVPNAYESIPTPLKVDTPWKHDIHSKNLWVGPDTSQTINMTSSLAAGSIEAMDNFASLVAKDNVVRTSTANKVTWNS